MKLRVYSFEKPLLSMWRGEPPGDSVDNLAA